jgi:hypothetical protein
MGMIKKHMEAIANVRSNMEKNHITIENLREHWFNCEPFMED